MQLKQRVLRISLLAVAALAVALFAARNLFLQYAFTKMQEQMLQRHGVLLTAGQVRFSGLAEVELKELCLQPLQRDTLLHIGQLRLHLSIVNLLSGPIGFDEVQLSRSTVRIVNTAAADNWRWLVRSPDVGEGQGMTTTGAGYSATATLIQQRVQQLFNIAFRADDFVLAYTDSTGTDSVQVPLAVFDRERLRATVFHSSHSDSLVLSGVVLLKNKSYRLSVRHGGNMDTGLPFLTDTAGLSIGLRSMNISLDFEGRKGADLKVHTRLHADNFWIKHWRLAQGPVHLPLSTFDLHWKIGDHSIELDSASTLRLQHAGAKLFACFQRSPDSLLVLRFQVPETPADTFFGALPQGMFQSLRGLSCSGTLQYSLHFRLPLQHPDSLEFSSALRRKNFKLLRFGNENFSRINDDFMYEAYDRDRPVRVIDVSPANPHYTPLHQISPMLVSSVLQAEDPSFMTHNGFLEEAFRESIIKNYKERRFARGGSTISMQLVKNVFLSRHKTIARKAEEGLIVYLIENLRLVSKERMLEVYLNVIEWGPGVYGIGEASRFYFNKAPASLTLPESLFLASIIPNPKYFKYHFDREGHLREHLSGLFLILSERMISKGRISETDTIGMLHSVKLRGPAAMVVLPEHVPEDEEFEF